MKRNRLLHALVPLLLLSACSGKDPLETQQKVNSYKVAVVLPESEKAELSKIVDWAQETIKSAQKGQESRIELELEWVDEDGATLARDIARITHDNSYASVIGPRYSRNARVIAKESLSYRMPVLAPSVTSTEFQRIYALQGPRQQLFPHLPYLQGRKSGRLCRLLPVVLRLHGARNGYGGGGNLFL